MKDGKVIGVGGVDLKVWWIEWYMNEEEIGYKGRALLVDGRGSVLVHGREEGKNI
ncbi:cache domain-containing protein [Bacillus sp. WP8]|uniref:cache domain-containing protein n=1 Tax=Bacillus sp. WP8 TaxID=756828 RepID=UPI0016428735|nr:cache domain-containing protein [Bacillus sp. WP8]